MTNDYGMGAALLHANTLVGASFSAHANIIARLNGLRLSCAYIMTMKANTIDPGIWSSQKIARTQACQFRNSGTIPPIYSQLANLSALSLQNNRLTGEIPTGFGNLSHIYHLNLSRNFLFGVVPFNSSFLKRLGRNLDLSSNPGLCLSPSEAFGVTVGIDVCGSNKTASSIRPLKKSEAPFQGPIPFILTIFWDFLSLHQSEEQ
ncbi:hypothetical protein Fot_16462 [Forsythia ovata]|uniref:Uncharacterized protein n=1 Tax=Forsythia ovata TaxID=205694 RepID=A0ABD1WC34_9LAMI